MLTVLLLLKLSWKLGSSLFPYFWQQNRVVSLYIFKQFYTKNNRRTILEKVATVLAYNVNSTFETFLSKSHFSGTYSYPCSQVVSFFSVIIYRWSHSLWPLHYCDQLLLITRITLYWNKKFIFSKCDSNNWRFG